MEAHIAEGIARWFPALFFTWVAFFYTARVLWLHKSGTTKRIEPRNADGSFCTAHLLFRILRVAIWAASVIRAVYPPFDTILWICPVLAHPTIMLAGNLILVASFLWIMNAHMTMGDSWRSGISRNAPSPLITHGVYNRSRNPIFLGVLAGQTGFFLAVPTVFSFICLTIGIWAISARVRKEEEYLAKTFGDPYVDYCKKTPRWIGFSSDNSFSDPTLYTKGKRGAL